MKVLAYFYLGVGLFFYPGVGLFLSRCHIIVVHTRDNYSHSAVII